MTPEEFAEAVNAICPHCRRGYKVQQRDDTKEWVHSHTSGSFSITICWADGLRRSRFNPDYKPPP